MHGGFKQSRYGTKWEEIVAATKRDGKPERSAASPQVELKDPVQPIKVDSAREEE